MSQKFSRQLHVHTRMCLYISCMVLGHQHKTCLAGQTIQKKEKKKKIAVISWFSPGILIFPVAKKTSKHIRAKGTLYMHIIMYVYNIYTVCTSTSSSLVGVWLRCLLILGRLEGAVRTSSRRSPSNTRESVESSRSLCWYERWVEKREGARQWGEVRRGRKERRVGGGGGGGEQR